VVISVEALPIFTRRGKLRLEIETEKAVELILLEGIDSSCFAFPKTILDPLQAKYARPMDIIGRIRGKLESTMP
jgi:hypothetical protein